MLTLLTLSMANADTGHCSLDETVIFTCTVKGEKVLSVCQIGGLVDFGVQGGLQYRFGPKGSPELIYPDDPADIEVWHYEEGTHVRGGSTQLSFESGENGYSLVVSLDAGERASGVNVSKNETVVAAIACQEPIVDNLIEVPTVIREP